MMDRLSLVYEAAVVLLLIAAQHPVRSAPAVHAPPPPPHHHHHHHHHHTPLRSDPVQTWTAVAGGFRLEAALNPTTDMANSSSPYTVFNNGSGEAWLEGLPPAAFCNGQWYDASDGTLQFVSSKAENGSDVALGAYSRLSWNWMMTRSAKTMNELHKESRLERGSDSNDQTDLTFVTRFYHYLDQDVFVFEQEYPQGCPSSNFTALPSNDSTLLGMEAHAALTPSSEFPSFRADVALANASTRAPLTPASARMSSQTKQTQAPPRLTSQAMGFATWGGVMTFNGQMIGTALDRFSGGARGGPLLLFDVNTTAADSMVLSRADAFFDSYFGVRTSCSRQQWRHGGGHPGFTLINGTDFVHNDLGQAEASNASECAAQCLRAPQCTCFTLDEPSPTQPSPKCWLKYSTVGQTSTDGRVSGYLCKDNGTQALAFGAQQYLLEIPQGTTLRAMLSPMAGGGQTAATAKWGRVLQRLHGTTRLSRDKDVIRTKLSYWTDNGAYYAGSQPLNITGFGKLAKKLEEQNIHIGTTQLDPWWYADAWFPKPGLFPNGLGPLRDELGVPLLLYHNFWHKTTAATYHQRDNVTFDFHASYRFLANGVNSYVIFQVEPSQAKDFYMHIYSGYVQEKVISATEVDFSNWQIVTMPKFFSAFNKTMEFWSGMADATIHYNMSLQACMSLPSLILASLRFPAVTNARAGPDGTPTAESRCRLGYTSLFMWALDVAPFLDNVWSQALQPGSPYNMPQHNVHLHLIISSFTAGPVGFGDGMDYINAALLNRTCDSTGRLLHPDKPLTPIDAMYSPAPPYRPAIGGDIYQSHTTVSVTVAGGASETTTTQATFYYLIATNVGGGGFSVLPKHLYVPEGAEPIGSMVVTNLEMADCGGLPTVFGDANPLLVQTTVLPSPDLGYDVYTLSPIIQGGDTRHYALVGEISKNVRVSGNRIQKVDATSGFDVHVVGGAQELVSMMVIEVAVNGTSTPTPVQCLTSTVQLDSNGSGVISFGASK